MNNDDKYMNDDVGYINDGDDECVKNNIKCDNCNADEKYLLIDNINGMTCTSCGVIKFGIVSEAEEVFCDNSVSLSRVGNFHKDDDNELEKGFGNVIPEGFTTHVYINGESKTYNMRRYNSNISMSYKERVFYNISQSFQNVNEQLHITSDVMSTSKYIIGEFIKSRLIIRKQKRVGFFASCIYVSCILCNSYRKREDICKCMNVSKKDYKKGLKLFLSFLNEKQVFDKKTLQQIFLDVENIFDNNNELYELFNNSCNTILENYVELMEEKNVIIDKCKKILEQQKDNFHHVKTKTLCHSILHHVLKNEYKLSIKNSTFSKLTGCSTTSFLKNSNVLKKNLIKKKK